MISSVDDARRYLLGLLPPGHEYLYDESPSGDVYLLYDALGQLLKQYGFDLVSRLRREIFPPTAQDKLPDWEVASGINNQELAQTGTTAQRQAGVVGKLREFGAFCDPVVQSVLGPLLGFDQVTPVQLVKADRSALRLLHSYGQAADVTLPHGTSVSVPILVLDGGLVSRAGVQLELNISAGDLSQYSVMLVGPDGTTDEWDGGPVSPVRIASKAFAGKSVTGLWTLVVHNGAGVDSVLYGAPWLFVEGIARGQDTGGAVFWWGAYADPAHLGENGATPDFASARRAIARIKHSHTVGCLLQSLEPWPDVTSGAHAAVPDECIPV